MKRNVFILLIVLLILVISTLILFAEEGKYDFRKTNWGMSREQVRATEKETCEWEEWAENYYIDFNGTIQDTECKTLEYFPVEINGKDYTCQYVFLKNRLYRGRYRNFGSDNIHEYKILKGLLNKKHGKAKIDQEIWRNDLFKGDSYYLETAIKLGHLIHVAKWETPTTDIELRLSNEDGGSRIMITLYYWSKELMRQKKQTEEKERIDTLSDEENKSNL